MSKRLGVSLSRQLGLRKGVGFGRSLRHWYQKSSIVGIIGYCLGGSLLGFIS
jgi:hypothetical protein